MPANDWRRANRDRFDRSKKRNYARGKKNPFNEKQEWTIEDSMRIVAPDRPNDRKLAEELGRSVQAIQVWRCRLKKAK